jgi:hypothetical protein
MALYYTQQGKKSEVDGCGNACIGQADERAEAA